MNSGKRKLRIPPGLGFLLPGLAGFTLFFIAPFGISLWYALVDKPVAGSFAGLRNFTGLFQNKAYLRGLFNTVRFIVISVPINMGLSLGLALLINKMRRYREYFTLIFLIPLVIPSGSMVFFWKSLFSYDGILNGLLNILGTGKINWLDSELALPVMVLIFIWKNAGYNMVLFLAGLHNIPSEYYEAVWMDNARWYQSFWHITLPCLMPTAVLVLIMSIINSFKIFREVFLIAGSYPHGSIYTLQHFMNNMFVSLNYPRLCAATALLVLFIAAATQALLRMERKAAP
jgi:multiple sugar transport system permease protein